MAERQRSKHLTAADGRRLAIDMLREIRDEVGSDATSIEEEYREGRPQSDVLARHLRVVGRAGPAVEAGFLAVLTDFLGGAFEAPTDPEFYEELEAKLH